ncbi:hypothetical protein RKD29_007940 [Streptomyces tendae]|uniref:FhaA domain-containing protein n=1 Tax=Streptomyces tendae TaxID=1932 RepID=UPI003833E525
MGQAHPMRLLRTSERTLERWATHAWSCLTPTKPEPGEVVAKILGQCDDQALILGRHHIVVPNDFIVELPPAIHQQLADSPLPVAPALSHQVRRHAAEHGYTFAGPVTIDLRPASSDVPARFLVHSRISPARSRP